MGSRAIMVVAQDEAAAAARFRTAPSQGRGVVYTRTGRPFFDDPALNEQLLARAANALDRAKIWEELASGWVVLDVELMPWSAKAQGLLEGQYAAVGAAAGSSVAQAVETLRAAASRVPSAEAAALLARFEDRQRAVSSFVDAYRRYCWPVRGLDDLVIAPFHLLASEGAVHDDKEHLWHLSMARRLAEVEPRLFRATPHLLVQLGDPESEARATAWWEELVARGGEGMVVKPRTFLARGKHGLVQPAIKCRGPEYLRIIYGPEYLEPASLERLRPRGLSHKRSMAARELALGLEALHRFVAREGLSRVHECVFGVLALESEPVDPRL